MAAETNKNDLDLDSGLQRIADVAKSQREGGYSTESDAMAALDLVERLARLLLKERTKPRKAVIP